MTMPLIKITDRKQALTYEEVQKVTELLNELTEVKVTFTDYKFEGNKKYHFYGLRIKKFPSFPQAIGRIHEMYGRKIDIQTTYVSGKDSEDYLDLYIRGYSKELK